MAVTVSGMFGNGKTYFADSPVVIDISGLQWSKNGGAVTSPFTIVRTEVIYNGSVVGDFRADTGGQTEVSFDISSALRAIWSGFDFAKEVEAARKAKDGNDSNGYHPGTETITYENLFSTSGWQGTDDDREEWVSPQTDSSGGMAIMGSTDMLVSNTVSLQAGTSYTVGFYVAAGTSMTARNPVHLLNPSTNKWVTYNAARLAKVGTSDGKDLYTASFAAGSSGSVRIALEIDTNVYIYNPYLRKTTEQYVNTINYQNGVRLYRSYSLVVHTEYLDSTDGEFTSTSSGTISGGVCAIGGLTEWERYSVANKEDADVSYREHKNNRNGDASTKPTDTPERVGSNSITSWVDVSIAGTKSVFYPASATPTADNTSAHAPIVLRDSQEYVDFLFVNRRGAVETCSGRMLEELSIDVETAQYARVERPRFQPSRSLMAIASGGRRSWSMSSGYQTREWAEWWTLEFLMARQWWMLYNGKYVPVIVTPAKKSVSIYDRSKQQMPHVDFTVTLALEG